MKYGNVIKLFGIWIPSNTILCGGNIVKQRAKRGKSIFEIAQDVEAAFEGNETQMLH